MSQRVSLDALNKSDKAEFVRLLDGLFEARALGRGATYAGRPFATVAGLHDAMMAAVRSRPRQEQIAFVSCHPDLAGKAARAGTMAPASVAEQAGLGLDQLSDDEFRRFEKLNAEYRRKFGFPFVICVRRQTRDAVLDAFERRLGNDADGRACRRARRDRPHHPVAAGRSRGRRRRARGRRPAVDACARHLSRPPGGGRDDRVVRGRQVGARAAGAAS